ARACRGTLTDGSRIRRHRRRRWHWQLPTPRSSAASFSVLCPISSYYRGERGAADRGEPNGSGLPPPAPILALEVAGPRPAPTRATPSPELNAEADPARQVTLQRYRSDARLRRSVVRPQRARWSLTAIFNQRERNHASLRICSSTATNHRAPAQRH